MKSLSTFVLLAALFGVYQIRPAAYVLSSGSRWPNSGVILELQLGSSGGPLADGCLSWGDCAEVATRYWNLYVRGAQLQTRPDSTVPVRQGNGYNNAFGP